MALPERRRRRPAVSCSLCRRRKIRCDRISPCSNCVRSGNTCVYDNFHTQPSQQHLEQTQSTESPTKTFFDSLLANNASNTSKTSTVSSPQSSSRTTNSTNTSTVPTRPSAREVESIQNQIRRLEERLSKATPRSIQSPASNSSPVYNIEATDSGLGVTCYFHRDISLNGQPQPIARSVTHKTRVFGQSHWMNGIILCRDIFVTLEPQLRDSSSKTLGGIQKCKSLAKIIKSQRAPQWPCPPSADLPPKDISDELVDCYLRTIETVYRILHVPTFRRDYEALWTSNTDPDTAFLVQLKLVLAIGAITYDDRFSLRPSAIRWVYEAQSWLSEPKFKSRLNILTLQIHLLHLIAREATGVGEDLIWISAGELLRSAIYMGLHRDPARLPSMTTFAAEMRRRIWNTILELALQSSMASGGPPLFSLDDFDTEPPKNFDDDQLVAEDSVQKPEDEFTQISIAIFLRKTLPVRLAITKFLNELRSNGSYAETLHLDAELKVTYSTLHRRLRECDSSTDSTPPQFASNVVDLIMHRYFLSLHIPFFGPALKETAYAYSRRVVVENALKIWYAAYPSSSLTAAQSSGSTNMSDRTDLSRFAASGAGFYRTAAMQATLFIAVELRAQLQEEESLGPVPFRSDLLSVLDESKAWCLHCVENGETNVKGVLLQCLVITQIQGLIKRVGKDEMAQLLIKAVEHAVDTCLPILEEMVIHDQQEGLVGGSNQLPLKTSVEGDWDFIMSDSLFNFGNTDPMGWMFSDETAQAAPLW